MPRDAKVVITGTATDSGDPLTDAVVVMRAEPTGFQALGGLGLAFTTVGMSCAMGVGEICRDNTRRVGTSAQGTFRFETTGEDLQDAFGTAQTVSFTVGGAPRGREISGPVTTDSTLVQVTELDLGKLALWRPEITVGAEPPATAAVSWTAGPVELPVKSYRVVFDDARGGVVWRQQGGGAVSFDARLLEGTTGGVSVVATAEQAVPDAVAELSFRSPRLPYLSGFAPPPSRGASCGTGGAPARDRCPLTDGDFATPIHPGVSPTVVDLGRRLDVSLLAVRGCGQSCPVEVSLDGATWVPLTTVSDTFGVVAPYNRPPARYVRITPDTSSSLTEVSVWDGDPPLPRRAALELAEPGVVARQEPDRLGGDSSIWPWVVGGIVVVLLAAGVGFLLGRRRGR